MQVFDGRVAGAGQSSMSGPYREPGLTPSFPAEQIAWRRSVAQGALGVVLVLIAKYCALSALAASPVVTAVVLTPFDLGLCLATWKLTTRAPEGHHAAWLGWLLRATVVAGALLWPLGALGPSAQPAAGPLTLAATGAGLLYVARLFSAFEAPRHAWLSRAAAAVLLVVGTPEVLEIPELHGATLLRGMLLVGGVMLAFYCLLRLAFVLRVARHELLWLDETETPPAWVALFVLADGRAEAFNAAGRLGYFPSQGDAEAWLGEHGMIRDEAAALAAADAVQAE